MDTIPPATDERTLLIDRTLVAYGLLTPEELVEIHKIGDQMLEIKGDLALAHEQARAAVLELKTACLEILLERHDPEKVARLRAVGGRQ